MVTPRCSVLGSVRQIPSFTSLGSAIDDVIFFTYALVLSGFYGVSYDKVPLYGLAFAVGNPAGPLRTRRLAATAATGLGRWLRTIVRRVAAAPYHRRVGLVRQGVRCRQGRRGSSDRHGGDI